MKIKIRETAKEKKGYSLYKLAKELNLPQQTVYSWANGRTQPSYACGDSGRKDAGGAGNSDPAVQ